MKFRECIIGNHEKCVKEKYTDTIHQTGSEFVLCACICHDYEGPIWNVEGLYKNERVHYDRNGRL